MAESESSSPPPLLANHDDTRLDRLSWQLVVIGSLVRLLYAAVYPMNLAGDEAYYWEWSRHLDWGYFSKPPGIAWLMALVTTVGGDHTVTLRVASAAIGVGSLIFVRTLARQLFDSRAGVLGVLLTLAVPANVLLNLMLTIDAPLVFCWSAALWCLWQWAHEESGRGGRWLAGLSLALAGGYLSKQMMLVFPLLAIVWLATSPLHRHRLKAPGFWIAIGFSLIALVPPLWWNSQHDWITFQHTGGQLAGDTDNRAFGVTFLEFLATQTGVLSPIIWFFVMAAAIIGLRHFRRLGDAESFLIVFSAPAIIVMILMALRQTMLPNWAAVYYIAALILVAGWLAGSAESLPLPDRWRRATKPALILGFLMVAVGYLWGPALEAAGYAGHPKLDPMRRLRGHDVSAEAIATFIEKAPRPEKTFIVALDHRYHASHFAFYLPGQPTVYRWERYDHIGSQFELWPNPIQAGKAGWDAIVIMPSPTKKITKRFEGGFESFESIGEVAVAVSPHYERYYRVYLGRSLKEWPEGIPLENPPAISTEIEEKETSEPASS